MALEDTPHLAIIDVSLWGGACDNVAEALADRDVAFVVLSSWHRELGTRNRFSATVSGSPSRPIQRICCQPSWNACEEFRHERVLEF